MLIIVVMGRTDYTDTEYEIYQVCLAMYLVMELRLFRMVDGRDLGW